MDTKMNHSELSALYAKATGLSQSEAESFSKAFFDLIIEGLESDGLVKINGLGTFKVVDVDSRESVNVSTGERFEIKGHRKLSFTPAESLKETINAPFAMFEPVEVDEDIDDEEQQQESDDASVFVEEPVEEQPNEPVAEKSEIIVAEIEEEMPAEESPSSVEEHNACVISEEMPAEEVAEQSLPIVDVAVEQPCEPVAESDEHEPLVGGDDSNHVSENADNAVDDTPAPENPGLEEKKSAKNEIDLNAVKAPENFLTSNVRPKKKGGYKYVALAAFILIAVVAVVAFLVNDNASDSGVNASGTVAVTKDRPVAEDKAAEMVHAADTVIQAVADDSVSAGNIADNDEPFVLIESLANRHLSQITVNDTTDYVATRVMAEHVVALEETLIKISLKHYGDKKLWPYIVMYNNMERPNDLACGMVLKIPRLVPRN